MEIVYSVVIPMYNEQEVLPECYRRVKAVMEAISEPYEIVFVNDGSRDDCPRMAADICASDSHVVLVNFARNFGHMAALSAGLDYARGKAVVVIDADLQDPPEVIPDMITEWKAGWDVVYGKRKSRAGETFFKKITAKTYYRLIHSLTNVDMPVDTGEFRLMDRKVVDAVRALPERHRYMRGLVSWVGFRQKAVEYDRKERFAGETKYPLKAMIKFAIDGITAFSYAPLKLAGSIGALTAVAGFVYLIVILCQKIFTDAPIQGWASTMVVMLFTNGVTLMVLGMVGEYIGRVFDEVKGRPVYIVREVVNGEVRGQVRKP